ncbi:hypothetical protein [Paraburkholderia atlantica]|uniref:hypothetical protein n=1 Tax=Paraburkholderia atlantica TaxID=2654982 RepID=UPI001590816F|nr:hypothetical protein [Paraburkholderia atlantica]NUY33597.1 hypothetical protein [Paraburkholderia atlantica]
MTQALAWTWRQFSTEQKTILTHFARDSESASLDQLNELARMTTPLPEKALDAISGLVDSAFIFRSYEGPDTRYRMLNTVRRFIISLDNGL